MPFLNPKKHCELSANSMIGTAVTRWEKVITDHVQVPGFQNTLDYFKSCLQEWILSYFSQSSCQKHFAFMRSKGSLTKVEKLKIDEYAFWKPFCLCNDLRDL